VRAPRGLAQAERRAQQRLVAQVRVRVRVRVIVRVRVKG
jgi:hypothetical protein